MAEKTKTGCLETLLKLGIGSGIGLVLVLIGLIVSGIRALDRATPPPSVAQPANAHPPASAPPDAAPKVPARQTLPKREAPLPTVPKRSPVTLSGVPEDITTIDGKKFEKVTITRVEPDGLVATTDAGIVKIPFRVLPKDLQTKFGFDPAQAQQFATAIQTAAAQRGAKEKAREAAGKAVAEAQAKAAAAETAAAKVEGFRVWALANTAVTYIEIKGPTMIVRLTAEKYTNRDNVRVIAETLARYYVLQTGERYMACHVWLGNEEYAHGTFNADAN